MTSPKRLEFNTVVEENLERVYRIALRMVSSCADAEDIAQNVFTEAYRIHIGKAIANWPAYLTRLAAHRSLDCLRERRRRPSAIREDVPDRACGPNAELEAQEIATWLRSEIVLLPDQQAIVFSLVCIEELTRAEVAAIVGTSVESVSTTLYKARKKLEQRFAAWQKGATYERR